MTRLEIILSCSILLTSGIGIVMFAYARSAIAKLLTVSEELGDLKLMMDKFAEHTKSVYELDMFYGDETLKHLMEHAASLNEQIETNFEYIYSLVEEENEEELTALEIEIKEFHDQSDEHEQFTPKTQPSP